MSTSKTQTFVDRNNSLILKISIPKSAKSLEQKKSRKYSHEQKSLLDFCAENKDNYNQLNEGENFEFFYEMSIIM